MPWPLTHDAISAFPDAVQLLELLHAPAPSQLEERVLVVRGLAANGTEDGYFTLPLYHLGLTHRTERSPHTWACQMRKGG